MPDVVAALHLSAPAAVKMIRDIAADTDRIVVIKHARKRKYINRRQIDLCVQKGTIIEGPFRNTRGNWQVSMRRHAAGEELTCGVVIEWATKLLVISAIPPKEEYQRRRR
jgi:hypothetical protein